MKRPWRSQALRAVALGLVAGVAFLASGDRAHAVAPTGIGIDPFDVLDLQVKNNVLFIIDTSGSMKWPPDTDNFTVGDDDPASRIYQAKVAVNAVIQANRSTLNFGLATYNVLDSSKPTIAQGGQDFDGDGQSDGPAFYVSQDANAGQWLGTATTPASVTGTGYFNGMSDSFATYSPQTSAGIFASFDNITGGNVAAGYGYSNAYPPGCTPGTTCRYYIQSRLYRNGMIYRWNRAAGTRSAGMISATAIAGGCPLPPAGLTGFNDDLNGDGLDDSPRACFQLQDNTTGLISTYYFSSTAFQSTSAAFCGGAAVLDTVSPCSGDNSATISAKMGAAAALDASGNPVGYPGAVPASAAATLHSLALPIAGLREDQSTPLAGSLSAIRTAATPAFPPSGAPNQKNFVILVTDGDDTCAGGTTDQNAVTAAVAAQNLYQQGGFNAATNTTTDFQHRAETMVIGFAAAVSPARINIIAQGGSGRNINSGAAIPPLTNAYGTCNPGGACRDAFTAQNTQELIDALTNALQQAASSGEFSTTRSVFDAIPEYVSTVPPPPASPTPLPGFSAMNPENRYQGKAFRTYQTTFEMPAFKGHVRAFDTTGQIWDAATVMLNRFAADFRPSPAPTASPVVFAALHGGLDQPAPFKPATGAKINRRIFTTDRNGFFPYPNPSPNPSPSPVMLWPPTSTVAPPTNAVPPALDPAGSLDDALGIGANSAPVLTIAQLQGTPFFACLGTPLPAGHPCLSATAAVKLARARHEVREMVLAYMAGAQVVRNAAGQPQRTAAGDLRYIPLTWFLAETTLAPPAVVTPPLQTLPTVHTSEYILYRDGPRISSGAQSGQAPTNCNGSPCLDQGFGLRNPDNDGTENPPNTGASATTRPTIKPVMSVLYVAANDMLHAFRAGPQSAAASPAPLCTVSATNECGGEELWGFVPYDQLIKLKKRMEPQSRDNHVYMIASGLRFAEIFVPSAVPFTLEGQSYSGVWRRTLVFGRGFGSRGGFGKYYTSLDITAPGPFTRASLDTQLPSVMWSRGNPDRAGVAGAFGTRNGTSGDDTLYNNMGQTWSIPAIARVNPNGSPSTNAHNNRLNVDREYVMFTGSGYGEVATEGTTFYTLDPITGDILASADVLDGAPTTFPSPGGPDFDNALVAPPAIYLPDQLVAGTSLGNPTGSVASAAYIGDIHGRIWKFDANTPSTATLMKDLGRNQPIAVAAALINLGSPHVYVGTGYDSRVPEPATHFELVGLDDVGTYPSNFVSGYPIALPASAGSGVPGFRTTVNPRTAFSGLTPVALFVATRFNPPVASCVSSFDTAIFAPNAANGAAAVYDLTAGGSLDISRIFTGVKAVGDIKGSFSAANPPGLANIDQGTPTGGTAPPPATTPAATSGGPTPVSTSLVVPGSSVCR